jgi:phospholipase C
MTKRLSLLLLLLFATGFFPTSAQLPPAKHVFVIVLENKSFNETFGSGSADPYLAHTLTSQGQLLTQYFGIGHNSAGNYLAMISGQAPDPQTQADCHIYSNFVRTGGFAQYGQLTGHGCVYPSYIKTVADQLEAKKLTWHGYMEDMQAACSHPALNTVDPTGKARPGNAYATRHNPFVYFHSITNTSACTSNDVPLTQLQQDLRSTRTTPNLAFVVPNLCHDGHDSPCADGEPGGLISADEWLEQYVPIILSSPAYKQDGVLIITSDEAESGPTNNAVACCGERPGPNASRPGINGPGGGRIGALVLSRFVKPGSRNAIPYNHYSLLKTIEDLFGLQHLGYAQPSSLKAFGSDVFSKR